MMINPRDEYLVNKGIEKGIEKGKEIGIEKGIEKEKFEIAKKLLPKMTIKEIEEITGLTPEQIQNAK